MPELPMPKQSAIIRRPNEPIEGFEYWAEHPDYPKVDWEAQVANGDTREGYWSWVRAFIEDKQEAEGELVEREYFIHTLNWPITGTSPEDAARKAAYSMQVNPSGFVLAVTDVEAQLVPRTFEGTQFDSEVEKMRDEGFEVIEDFDSEKFELTK